MIELAILIGLVAAIGIVLHSIRYIVHRRIAQKMGGTFFVIVSTNLSDRKWSIGPFKTRIDQIAWNADFARFMSPFMIYARGLEDGVGITHRCVSHSAVDLNQVVMLPPKEVIHGISVELDHIFRSDIF